MHGVFHNQFIEAGTGGRRSDIVLLGCPLDVTSSFRSGSKFGPESLRRASWTLETYSPYLDMDLEDIDFSDMGDLELPPVIFSNPWRSSSKHRALSSGIRRNRYSSEANIL